MKGTDETTIPVAFATDDSYALPYLTAVHSLFGACHESTRIKLYTIIPNGFSQECINTVLRMATDKNMPAPIFLYPSQEYDDAYMSIGHTTRTTYYRLDLPSLLKKESKCIYLDCDVLVTSDIRELYEVNIDNHYLAGVKAAGYYYPEERQQSLADALDIAAFDQYINAGVLLMNLDLIRKDGIEERFKECLSKNFESQDQDIINAACYGKIRTVSPKFNLMVKYHPNNPFSYSQVNGIDLAWSEDEWREACLTPVVVHYADEEKPWDSLRPELAEKWWAMCTDLERCGYAPRLQGALLPTIDKLDKLRTLFSKNAEDAWQQVQSLYHQLEISRQELVDLRSSTTWKAGRFVTAPFRQLKQIIYRIGRAH